MTYKAYAKKLELIKQLIKLKITGTPTDLGNKLMVTERTARRMIGYLKGEGLNIKYSRKNKTYYHPK